MFEWQEKYLTCLLCLLLQIHTSQLTGNFLFSLCGQWLYLVVAIIPIDQQTKFSQQSLKGQDGDVIAQYDHLCYI